MSTFDAEEGEMRLADALIEVELAANERWKAAAHEAVREVAREQESFTTDDVWRVIEMKEVSTHEPRALGAIMKNAVKDGVCENTDRYQNSIRAECHRRRIPVYRSMVHQPPV